MSGHWRIDPTRDSASTTISCIETDEGQAAGAQRSRGASARSTWCRPPSSTTGRRSRRLGPEPLGPRRAASSGSGWRAAPRRSSCCCSTSGSSPGSAISMCARRCIRAGIHPKRAGGSISLDRLKRLVAGDPATCSPKRSRPADRRLRDFAAPDGELGYFSKSFAVYDREGKPCALRRDGQTDRPGRPLDLLLPAMPALTLT